MTNNAVFVRRLDNNGKCESLIGVSPLAFAQAQDGLYLLVESPDAEEIYRLAVESTDTLMRSPTTSQTVFCIHPRKAASKVLCACAVDIVDGAKFRYKVLVERKA